MIQDTEAERYPTGRFTYDGDTSSAARDARTATLAELPGALRAAVNGLSNEQLATPYREGGWTVRQLVHHVADSHMNAYIRFKLALTEQDPTIKPYEESEWAKLADTDAVPADVSLALLESLHARWVALLRAMSSADFERGYFHPDAKRVVPLDEALAMYAWHSKHHTAHVTRLRQRRGW
jgi:uncharacterized damage-inducible protein DinB